MAPLRMERCLLWQLLVGLVVLLSAPVGRCFHYDAPSDCQWNLMNLTSLSSGSSAGSMNEVALHCRLRTINSQFDQTNFSVVPREHTASLTIECSDSLLYQR